MCRDGRSAQQSAAAHGSDDQVDVRMFLEQLDRRGPGAGDDALIVVGMHLVRAGLREHLGELRLAGVQRRGAFHDVAAVAANRVDLGAAARLQASRRSTGCRTHGPRARGHRRGCPTSALRPRRDASVSGTWSTALNAPRALNAPLRWKFSHLSRTWVPARSSSVRLVITGVRWTCGAIRARAAQTSSNVITR